MSPQELQTHIDSYRAQAHHQEGLCGSLGASTDAGFAAYTYAQRLHKCANTLTRCLTLLQEVTSALLTAVAPSKIDFFTDCRERIELTIAEAMAKLE